MSTATSSVRAAAPVGSSSLARLVTSVIGLLERIPNTLHCLHRALLHRVGVLDLGADQGRRASWSTSSAAKCSSAGRGCPTRRRLFQDEYKLPFIAPEIAAPMAATGRAPVPAAAADRPRHPLLGAGAARHDAGDPDLRLPRRLPDARHLGGTAAVPDRPRPRRAVGRPLAGPPPCGGSLKRPSSRSSVRRKRLGGCVTRRRWGLRSAGGGALAGADGRRSR